MSDLSKLTVAKLKNLCKEKGLKNYSKLSKPSLLEKLGAVGSGPNDAAATSSHPFEPTKEKTIGNQVLDGSDGPSDVSRTPGSSIGASSLPGSISTMMSRTEPPNTENPAETRRARSSASSLKEFPEYINSPVSSGPKRSNDSAFPEPAVSQQPKASKRPKNAYTPSISSNSKRFKVPDVPLRDNVTSSSSAQAMNRCFPTARPSHSQTMDTSSASHIINVEVSQPTDTSGSLASDNRGQIPIADQPTVPTTSEPPPATLSNPDNATTSSNAPRIVNLSTRTNDLLDAGSQSRTPSLTSYSESINPKRALPRADFASYRTAKSSNRPIIGLSTRVVSSSTHIQIPSTPSSSTLRELPPRAQKSKFTAPRSSSVSLAHQPARMAIPLTKRCPTHNPQTMEVSVLPRLKNITMPPSMSQRKSLPMFSLALSCLNDVERAICVPVSKFLRYAVYLSAQDILNRWFSGGRLSRLLYSLSSRGHSLSMLNLWPYLRLRQQEVSERRKVYENGWVPRFFHEMGAQNTSPLSEKLWTSPDFEEQLLVVLRFIQTRICFSLTLHASGNAALRWITSTVIDAQEVLEKEIWSITVIASTAETGQYNVEETFYVLYQTCEVIGHPPPSKLTSPSNGDTSALSLRQISRIPLRADWSSYIELRLPIATRHLHAPLREHIRGTNVDNFERGIAKVWLKRVEGQGDEGRMKKQVAERYVLGCVVGNSVSGEYRSTTHMAMEFASIPEISEAGPQRKNATPRVNLYIPERHSVESVHFTNRRGALHPDISVLQTVGRQEGTFVLRENGVVIGEDERVPEIWMKLLGCSENGVQL